MSPVTTWMGDHPDWCHCFISVICDHAMPCCVLSPLVERLVGWAYKRFSIVVQSSLKAGMCTIMPMWQVAQKRTCVDHWNIPNHHTSTCLGCGIFGMYGCEGVWFKVIAPNVWLTDLYALQGVDLGGSGSYSY